MKGGGKILVIEDEAEMRRNVSTILRLEDFEVLTAKHGREGLELARREAPDLILCDVMMPEMDGHTVLKHLREDERTVTIPFVFLTARGEKEDLRSGMNLGADDYLTKPVSKGDLLSTVNARLKRGKQLEGSGGFNPRFDSYEPLLELGLTPRVAEVLLWVAQGKTNPEIGMILGISEWTVKKHVLEIFEKLGVETRTSATLKALEYLSKR
ncbi:MAG: response regulator transcription factor [Verrucomicrobiota bacterium]|nr:response regulator transcription factor [Verrucomicrobiota bacterium]